MAGHRLLLGGGYAIENAVNDNGQIVGCSGGDVGARLPRLLMDVRQAGVKDLGPGHRLGCERRGAVVGSASWASSLHAFSWTASGGLVDLGAGSASDVNDASQVVGYKDCVGTGMLSRGRRPAGWST